MIVRRLVGPNVGRIADIRAILIDPAGKFMCTCQQQAFVSFQRPEVIPLREVHGEKIERRGNSRIGAKRANGLGKWRGGIQSMRARTWIVLDAKEEQIADKQKHKRGETQLWLDVRRANKPDEKKGRSDEE